jgi:voltage-gated potassium channel
MVAIVTLFVTRFRRSQSWRLVGIGCVCLLLGAELFSLTQHISYGLGLYWAITTATTVGYGDVTPKNTSGRVVAAVVMLTTIPLFASAFALFAGAVASSHLRRLLGMVRAEESGGAICIIGAEPLALRLASELLAAGERVVIVGADPAGAPDAAVVIAGSPTSEEALRRARPESAARILVTGANDADVLVSAVLLRQLAPAVPVFAVAGSPSVCAALGELGVSAAVSADDLLVHTLAKSLEAPHAAELLLRLVDSDDLALVERAVAPGEAGRSLAAVRSERGGLVLGAVHGGRVHLGVSVDVELAADDRLLLLERVGERQRGERRTGAR